MDFSELHILPVLANGFLESVQRALSAPSVANLASYGNLNGSHLLTFAVVERRRFAGQRVGSPYGALRSDGIGDKLSPLANSGK